MSSKVIENRRVRFAPSPTGHLHIGTARTALFNWLFARRYGGRFILRIEDTDRARSTKAFENSIIDSLRWLGLNWDEGPGGGGSGDSGPYRQSERLAIYQDYAEQLLKAGAAYYCYCSQRELENERKTALAAGRMPMYSGRCRSLSVAERRLHEIADKPKVVRFNVQKQHARNIEFNDLIKGDISISSQVIGDFIIMKADSMPTYNFAATVDDLTMSITDVLRGEDHITNTVRQIMIFNALNKPAPAYGHFSMILGADKAKLSKRHGATSITAYRDQGYLPEAIINYLSLLSWSAPTENEIFSLTELAQEFSIARVSKSPAIFDQGKLDWLNGQWLRGMSAADLAAKIIPYISQAGYDVDKFDMAAIALAIQSNLTTLSEAPKYAKIFLEAPEPAPEVEEELDTDSVKEVVRELSHRLETVAALNIETAKTILKETVAALKTKGIKGRAIYHPLRLALTGENSGPELFLVINALGRRGTLVRLRRILNDN